MAARGVDKVGERVARRSRHLARQVAGRLFVCAEGLFLVDGMPTFKELRRSLESLQQAPGPGCGGAGLWSGRRHSVSRRGGEQSL